MADEPVIGKYATQVGMPVEHHPEHVKCLPLEPVRCIPHSIHRGQARLLIIGGKHLQAQALVERGRQQVQHHTKTQPLPRHVLVLRIVDRTQINQLIELTLRRIPQHNRHIQIIGSRHLDGDFTMRQKHAARTLCQHLPDTGLQRARINSVSSHAVILTRLTRAQ